MSNSEITNVLMIVLILMIFILMVLSVVFLILKMKEKTSKKVVNKQDKKLFNSKKSKDKKGSKINTSYSKQSIMDFMEFDEIDDNMIVQKNGYRYLMAIECQGVNYDLMSKMEKISVEEGFQQFLNTLRHPIQIYIQTRTINLESSILRYKEKVDEIEKKYNKELYEYNSMVQSENYTQEELQKKYYNLTKQRNLLEYGKDIVSNTEKMSLNKGILSKKYYIIIPYFSEEASSEKYDREELKNMAFSELYTKAQSIIRTLSSCSINAKILSSKELVELLYEAYNREESETYGIDKALRAEYDSLYSTAPDVFEKKIKLLDEQINDKAIDVANDAILKVKSRSQRIAEKKEEDMNELINKMAQIILENNKQYVGEEVAKDAIEEIKKEGEEANEKTKKVSTRGRKKQSAK